MKRIINYIVCSMAICTAIFLTTAGGLHSLIGIAVCGLIYLSALKRPTWWKMFYRTNLRILNYFGLL